MDQPVEYDPQAIVPESIDGEVMPDGEFVGEEASFQETAFQKYWRENRLLNSMLMALLLLLILFGILWNIIIFRRSGVDSGTDFADAGQQISPPQQKKQQQVRLKQRQKKTPPPSTSSFRAKAISDIAIPDVAINTQGLNPQVTVDVNTDVGDVGTGVDLSALNKAFTSSFMGVKTEANKICFIIDYSASMKGRDLVMRSELVEALNKLPPTGEVCVIFFSGPTWLAGEDARALHKNWQGTNGAGWFPKPGFKPSRPKWIPVTPSTQKRLAKAVWETPLTYGTVWNNSFEWAFYLSPPPDVIYFMTDGASSPPTRGMELIQAKKGRTKIYTIGYASPGNAKGPLQEIAAMSGAKSKFVSMEQIKEMEKKIPARNRPAPGKKPPKKK